MSELGLACYLNDLFNQCPILLSNGRIVEQLLNMLTMRSISSQARYNIAYSLSTTHGYLLQLLQKNYYKNC